MFNNQDKIADFIKPLNSIEEVFMLLHIYSKTDCQFEIEFITETFNSIFSSKYETSIIKLAIGKFTRLLKLKDEIIILKEKLKNHHAVVPLPVQSFFYGLMLT